MRTDDDAPLVAQSIQRRFLSLIFGLLSSFPNPGHLRSLIHPGVTMFQETPFLLPFFLHLIYLPWTCPGNDTYNAIRNALVHHGLRRASLKQKHKCIATVSSNATHISEFVKRNPYPRSLSGTPLFKGREACVAARLGQLRVVFVW